MNTRKTMNKGPFAVPKGTTVSVRNSSTVLIVRKTQSTDTLFLHNDIGGAKGPPSGLFGGEDDNSALVGKF